MPVLTGIDILGIQRYVFASNRLRDVLAASWTVEHVTSVSSLAQSEWETSEDQVLLAAGGNAILEFPSVDSARNWTSHYTRWLYDAAPGLEVAVAHREYESRPLAWALKALQIDLARVKLDRIPSVPQLGLSVTASCSVTGLPATGLGQQGELLSRCIMALRDRRDEAKSRWERYLSKLPWVSSAKAGFPDELDLLGRSYGDQSTLGVVHLDGNGVGQAIARWIDRCIVDEVSDEDVRAQYREWSNAIGRLGDGVLEAVVARVGTSVRSSGSGYCLRGTPEELGFDLSFDRSEQRIWLPIRPLLLGGDDLTFLCDGRIALDLAAAALGEFAKHAVPHLGVKGGGNTLSACAGVALVKPHAPFHRSYELAENLCESAKRARRQANESAGGQDTGSWLDWHVGATRPGESSESIRKRQYERGQRTLTMRPYPATQTTHRKQSWPWLDRSLLGPDSGANDAFRGFRQSEPGQLAPNAWSGSRSRVKQLAQVVVDGGCEVKRQLDAWRAIETGVRLPGGLGDAGFVGSETPLLDAIELLDLHLRLEPDPRTASLRSVPPVEEVERR